MCVYCANVSAWRSCDISQNQISLCVCNAVIYDHLSAWGSCDISQNRISVSFMLVCELYIWVGFFWQVWTWKLLEVKQKIYSAAGLPCYCIIVFKVCRYIMQITGCSATHLDFLMHCFLQFNMVSVPSCILLVNLMIVMLFINCCYFGYFVVLMPVNWTLMVKGAANSYAFCWTLSCTIIHSWLLGLCNCSFVISVSDRKSYRLSNRSVYFLRSL